MTEHQIEIIAERRMDRLDEQFLKGTLSQEEYDKAVREIEIWTRDARYWRDNVCLSTILP
jgi:hypothetical protein